MKQHLECSKDLRSYVQLSAQRLHIDNPGMCVQDRSFIDSPLHHPPPQGAAERLSGMLVLGFGQALGIHTTPLQWYGCQLVLELLPCQCVATKAGCQQSVEGSM